MEGQTDMKLDSLKNENIILFTNIISIAKQNVGKLQKTFSVKDLLMEWKTFQSMDESELYNAIGWGVKTRIIAPICSEKKGIYLFMFLQGHISVVNSDRITISVSIPLISKFGSQRTLFKYNFMSTKEVFSKILESAKEVIRDSSQFLKKNIVDNETFPEFPELISFALVGI